MKMKNTKNIKLIAFITALSLIFCAMVGISAFAEDADAAVTVAYSNLCYNEMMHIAVNLECTEELAEGDTLGILIWDNTAEGELTAANATFKNFTEKEDEGGTKYFTSHAIPAPEMADEIKIAGCIKDADGNVRIGTVITYSIVEYLNHRIANDSISAEQLDLYKKTLAYGKAAGAVFAD